MTFQPPPPPPGGNPPPPPPAQWGPPPGGGYPAPQGGFDPKNVNPLDWGILGAGLLAFIFSLFDYYTVSAGGLSESESAWHGFFGWFATLLAVIGAVLVAMDLFAPQVKLPIPTRLAGLAAFAAALLFAIIALFVFPVSVPSGFGIDTGRGFGYWASLIMIIAGVVLSLMRLQQTGGKLPGALANMPNIGARGPQGGIGGPVNQPPPGYQAPAPGYQPPPAGYPQQPPPPGYQQQPPPPGYGPPPGP
jgi:hypothetical protein